jgi:hypothetical protein
VANGVDAAVQAVQAAGLDPMLNRPRPEPGIEELSPRDHVVLRGGELGDHGIERRHKAARRLTAHLRLR